MDTHSCAQKNMENMDTHSSTAFAGSRNVASGTLLQVAIEVKRLLDEGESESVLIFDDVSGEPVEIDFRGSLEEVRQRMEHPRASAEGQAEPPHRGPGRPRLGVVSREVSLLPRHWDWLNAQPGGASTALRKLVEEARKVNQNRDKVRQAQEAAYRFLSAMAGNLPGFEEALRALFAGNRDRFVDCMAPWPEDIRHHACKLSASAFPR